MVTQAESDQAKLARAQHRKAKKLRKAARVKKFTLVCEDPVNDKLFEISAFEKFLREHIKIDGKLNNLRKKIKVRKTSTALTFFASCTFSKRYLKYLSKKFLKKQQLRDYLRVVATKKGSYTMKYFTVADEEEEEN